MSHAPELRSPLPTDTLIVYRGDERREIALADLLRALVGMASVSSVAADDLLFVYDVSASEVKAVTVERLLAGPAPTSSSSGSP